MSNLLTLKDVREARVAALANQWPSLSEDVLKSMAGDEVDGLISKGLMTTGIISGDGTTGGDAAKVQDLSAVIGLQALGERHCATYNLLNKVVATSDAVEATTADSVGETVGGGYIDPSATDGGTVAIDGSLDRTFVPIKWYASQFMTFVNADAVKMIGFDGKPAVGKAQGINQYMAFQRHMRNLNWSNLHADNTKNALEPTGILPQIRAVHTNGRPTRYDANSSPFTPELLADLGALVYQASGSATDVIAGANVMADWQKQLSPGQRGGYGGEFGMLPYPDATFVQGMSQDPTKVKLHRDLDLDAPAGIDDFSADPNAPTAPTSAVGTAGAGSLNWRGNTGLPAGTYYYSAVAVGAKGRSAATASSGVVVTAGQSVSLVCTRSDTATKEYRIYRGLSTGTRKFLGRVICNASTNTFVDNGEKDPGTASAVILTIAPMGDGEHTVQNQVLYPTNIVDLPRYLMAFNKSYLTGYTPQVRTPFQQIVVENIARF